MSDMEHIDPSPDCGKGSAIPARPTRKGRRAIMGVLTSTAVSPLHMVLRRKRVVYNILAAPTAKALKPARFPR